MDVQIGKFYTYRGIKCRVIGIISTIKYYDPSLWLDDATSPSYLYEVMFEDYTTAYVSDKLLEVYKRGKSMASG